MIAFFLLLFIVSLAYLPFRGRIFEVTAATLLIVPVLAYPIGHFVQLNSISYGAILLLVIGALYLVLEQSKEGPDRSDIAVMSLWAAMFVVTLSLCYRWTDFMPQGERLRDYALLSELIKRPVYSEEPWLSGAALNYYAYWYRFGSFLSSLLNLEVWRMYHVLQAVTFSLFIASCFRFLNTIARCGIVFSLVCSVVIGFGSNIAGVLYALGGEHDSVRWWGPSRVVAGAINEFPAWSFLLGDLHPHYLNLALIPLVVLLLVRLIHAAMPLGHRAASVTFLATVVTPLFIYNANAWEVPVWGMLCGYFVVLGALTHHQSRALIASVRSIEVRAAAPYLAAGIALSVSLWLSARNISGGGDPFRLIRDPIKLTTTRELFLHWGFPLSAVALCIILQLRGATMKLLAFASLVVASLISQGASFLLALCIFNVFRLLSVEKDQWNLSRLVLESIGLVSLTLLFIPEVVFLDDPYGGENERMNTVFKAYTANWALLHLFGFWLLKDTAQTYLWRPVQTFAFVSFIVPLAGLLCLFFVITIDDRKSGDYHVKPIEIGLSGLDARYPGAANALKAFQSLPDGPTLESQGNPYSLTSHVATLGGKSSYLGWMNHVDLLIRRMDETRRRNSITTQIYTALDCGFVANTMREEGIRYLVIGPLERERFPELREDNYLCLGTVVHSGAYRIFEVPAS